MCIRDRLEHLPGTLLEGNHTISLRGLKANDTGGHGSTRLITIDIMLMDTENAFVDQTESSIGFSTSTLAFAVLGLVALFLIVLLAVGAISNKEEGTLAGVDFSTLSDGSITTAATSGTDVQDATLVGKTSD